MKRKFALAVSVMAALLVVGAVLVLTSQPTQAASSVDASARAVGASTLLLNDNFDYGTTAMSLTTASGGNWANHSGAAPYAGYTTTSLSMAGYGSSGVGGAATILTNGSEDVNRTFITQTSGTVYFAALVNVSAAGTGGAYFLHLKDGGTINFRARVFAKSDLGALRFGLSDTSTGIYSTAAFTYNTTYLLVVKYGAATGDTALYVLDTFSATEPGTALIAITGTAQSVLSVAIRQASGGPSAIIDGIRVANTWADVVGVVAALEADLGVSKDGPATALAGEAITYTISLSNTGTTTATGTLVTDTLPAEVTFVTYTTALPNAFARIGSDLVWDLGAVANGASDKIEVQVTISPALGSGASFTNTVTASTTYTEQNQANNTDHVTTFVGAPDLVIVKTGPAGVDAGDTFTYTLAYSNAGTIDATDVAIVDHLPAGVIFVSETTGSAAVANRSITWTLGTLTADTAGSILLTATARYAGDWPNEAAISGGPIDSNPANNTSIVTTTVHGADPFVRKSGPAIAFGGELISYTITYGNSGSVTATTTLTDRLPIGFTLADIALDNSGLPFVNGVWTADIAPATEVSFTFALTVPTAISSTTRITNSLSISALEAGDDPGDNAASASGTVYQLVPIAMARAGTTGQTFAIEGQVIVLPGTYSAGEWELQDASGAIALFYTPAPAVSLGDRIRLIAALIAPYNAQQQLGAPSYFKNLGAGTPVVPKPFTTGAIAAGVAQGWLAVISGTLSNVGTCAGNYDLFVNDGSGAADVFINSFSAGAINPCAQGFANGEWAEVTGFSTIFSSTTKLVYEVRPRSISDFVRFPRVVSTNPISGAVAVPVAATITATFNMSMTNVGASTLVVTGPAGAVAGTVAYDAAAKTATFTPAAALAGSTLYTATLKAALTADNGRSFMPAQDVVWTFTTRPLAPNLSASTKTNAINGVVKPGDLVTYTISLINTGDADAAALITDVLPSYYTVAQLLDFTQPTTGTLTWTGVVTAGQTVNVQFVARVKPVGQLPIGSALLFNSAEVNDGAHPAFTLNDPTPPLITIYGIYLPLVRR